MSVWTARPRSTPRHGEANINVHVLCHRDFIRCFLCNCISRTTVMKMPQRANEMNCETSPSRRRCPPPAPGRGDPAPAPSKVLGDLLGINNRLFARVPPLSTPHPDVRASLELGQEQVSPRPALGGKETGCSCAPKGLPSLLGNPGGGSEVGGEDEKISRFLAARHPSALQPLNGITALSISCFKPLIEAGTESSGLNEHPQRCCAPSPSSDSLH